MAAPASVTSSGFPWVPIASTSKATRIGTLAADCIGVPLSGMSFNTRLSGLVGRYRSSPCIWICRRRRESGGRQSRHGQAEHHNPRDNKAAGMWLQE